MKTSIITSKPYSMFVLLLVLLASIYLPIRQSKWNQLDVIKWDASGYYLYLPAFFIYKDIGHLKFYDAIDQKYLLASGEIKQYGLYPQSTTGKILNKYAIGVALAELPLFILADVYCKYINPIYECDGYSLPYQMAVAYSTGFWTLIGTLFLLLFLIKIFKDKIAALAVLLIVFGTNLFCYSYSNLGMSHSLMFMLHAALLYYTYQWYQKPKIAFALAIGLLLGWISIARPIDIVAALIVICWPMALATNVYKNRLNLWKQHIASILWSIIVFIGMLAIQLLYWKYITGHFIHFSYQDEGFNFLKPELFNGLFSFRKGWFIYTPLAFIALSGIFFLKNELKAFRWILICYFVLFIYIVFSWWMWYYGWGFGARAMIDSYAILAIALGALLNYITAQKRLFQFISFSVLLFVLWLNLYQTKQFEMGAIQGDHMNRKFYFRVWNKLHPSPEDWKYYNP